MGELIRKLRLPVEERYVSEDIDPYARYCASACFFMSAAGVSREAFDWSLFTDNYLDNRSVTRRNAEQCGVDWYCPNGYCEEPERSRRLKNEIEFKTTGLGIHRPHFDLSYYKNANSDRETAYNSMLKIVEEYLIKMDVDQKYFSIMKATPPDEMFWICRSDGEVFSKSAAPFWQEYIRNICPRDLTSIERDLWGELSNIDMESPAYKALGAQSHAHMVCKMWATYDHQMKVSY